MKTRVDSLLFFSERWLFVLHLFNHDYNIRATYVVNILLVNATPVILLGNSLTDVHIDNVRCICYNESCNPHASNSNG
mgnify:CR=1 FL=1